MSSNSQKLRTFLCHAKQDKTFLRELYARLLDEGWIDPWLDVENLLGGQDWDLEIRKAVRNADVIIVSLSNASITKEGYIQKEIRLALDIAEEKPEGAIFIIPLRLEECNVPYRLAKWQWVDYFVEGSYDRLTKSLRARAEDLGIAISKSLKAEIAKPALKPAPQIVSDSNYYQISSNEKSIGDLATDATNVPHDRLKARKPALPIFDSEIVEKKGEVYPFPASNKKQTRQSRSSPLIGLFSIGGIAFLSIVCIIMLFSGYYAFQAFEGINTRPRAAESNSPSIPASNFDVSGEVPDGGLGDDATRYTAWLSLQMIGQMSGCDTPTAQSTTISVTQQPDSGGVWAEAWNVDCGNGSFKSYNITFTPKNGAVETTVELP